MSSVKVKICGLSRREDIEAANSLLPDFIGFVFYAKSSRAVSAEQAQALKELLDRRIRAVGVFVNAEQDYIISLAKAGIIDVVQLHGDEDAAYCASLRRQISLPLIRAVRVRSSDSLKNLQQYPVDYFLLDTYQKGVYGGTGQRLQLDVGQYSLPKPYFIAGGLNAENIAAVLKENKNAFAVDVSGGVESNGLKDPEKMSAFIAQVRGEVQ